MVVTQTTIQQMQKVAPPQMRGFVRPPVSQALIKTSLMLRLRVRAVQVYAISLVTLSSALVMLHRDIFGKLVAH
jgi:hypothetical protein